MPATTWTIRQPIAGVQQPDVASDVQTQPLGARLNAVKAGVDYRLIYGKVAADLAANAAATFDQATGLIAAGTASAVDGNIIPAAKANQYAWMIITSET